MATDFLKEAPWLEGENIPVPVVDPADLKIVWEWRRKVKKERGKQFGFRIRHHRRPCSPGANMLAIRYRVVALQMLEFICEKTGKNLPWSQDNPDDSIFNLLATFPMTGARSSELEELIRILGITLP
jgi:hypothetical protein